ncbi:MAG: hypothetical protein ACE149_11405 [Armatimonadota bacterium]
MIAVLGTLGLALPVAGGLSSCEQPINNYEVCHKVADDVERGCCSWYENFHWYREYPCYPDKYTKGGTTAYWKDGGCQESTSELCTRINEPCPC